MGDKTLSTGNALLEERHSITCKLCKAKFESLGDMQAACGNRTLSKRRAP